jgi:hypothetical protein
MWGNCVSGSCPVPCGSCALPVGVCHAGHMWLADTQYSLLSVGQICDSGCDICFTATVGTIKHNDAVILFGGRDLVSGLLYVDMATPQPVVEHNVYESHTLTDRNAYLHATSFSPVKYTWIKVIENGNFPMWSGLTSDNVRNHLPKSDAMVKIHINQLTRSCHVPSKTGWTKRWLKHLRHSFVS